jgi:hypothetical protein
MLKHHPSLTFEYFVITSSVDTVIIYSNLRNAGWLCSFFSQQVTWEPLYSHTSALVLPFLLLLTTILSIQSHICLYSKLTSFRVSVSAATSVKVTALWCQSRSQPCGVSQGHSPVVSVKVTALWYQSRSQPCGVSQGHSPVVSVKVTALWCPSRSQPCGVSQGHSPVVSVKVTAL